MKKLKMIIVVSLCLVSVFVLSGCLNINLNKTSITAEDFKTKMEAKGYSIKDATNQFSDYTYVKQVYLAINSDSTFQIEFYELENESYAKNFFETNKTKFEESKGSSSAYSNVDIGNHSKYTQSSNGYFSVISRIDNTAIYVNVSDNYKDTVNSVLKDLGY